MWKAILVYLLFEVDFLCSFVILVCLVNQAINFALSLFLRSEAHVDRLKIGAVQASETILACTTMFGIVGVGQVEAARRLSSLFAVFFSCDVSEN